MGEPALKIVPPKNDHQKKTPDPDKVVEGLNLGDVFDEDRMKELYKAGVEALAYIAANGNDNAKMGAAAKLVDLFKKTAQQSGAAKKKIQIRWRNPMVGEDAEGPAIDDLLG